MDFDIANIDWEQAWRDQQHSVLISRDVEFWDSKAPRFADKKDSNYFFDFCELANIQDGESIFDMGCGSGTFAIPYAQRGHEVYAIDFSPKMLQFMMEEAISQGIGKNLHPVLLTWNDDWQTAGIPQCDVAIASRSMNAEDLKDALRKLDSIAKRKVCITLPGGTCLRADSKIMAHIGVPIPLLPDYIFAQFFLLELNIKADVKLFGTPKLDIYDSVEQACQKNIERIGNLSESQKCMVCDYLYEHLVEFTDDAGKKHYAKDYTRDVRWAFLTWEK